jgi:hypothetical protein
MKTIQGFDLRHNGIFARPTYLGLLEGFPDKEMTLGELESLKEIASSISWLEPQVILNGLNLDEKLLPHMAYIAYIVSWEPIKKGDGSHALLIWFDDGDSAGLDVNASMYAMLEKLDWKSIATDWYF